MTVFRGKSENEQPKPQMPEKDRVSVSNITADPPYTDYEKINNHPFIVDYFKLGDTWNEKLGDFTGEAETVDQYLKHRIETGELQNDIKAVRKEMEKVFKMVGISKEERTTMQIEKLAAYMEYLLKLDNIKVNHRRYG